MSSFPILTLLTVLPLLGAAIALWSGRHARAVAMVTTGISLALAVYVWISCRQLARWPWSSNTRGCHRWALNITSASTDWAR